MNDHSNIPSPRIINRNSAASLPGHIKVDYRVWIRCFPAEALPYIIGLPILIIAGVLAGFAADNLIVEVVCGIGALALAAKLGFEMMLIRERFLHGCANPGVVVSTNPFTIAVLTDLSNNPQRGSYNVVKVLRQPLDRASGPRPRVGDHVVTVAVYQGGENVTWYWHDFYPIAVQCVTDDGGAVLRLRRKIDADPDGWQNLEIALRQVPKPYRPGLYHVSV